MIVPAAIAWSIVSVVVAALARWLGPWHRAPKD
jgi:hypothetical protein